MKTFYLRILSAERPFYQGECESLIIPTPEGLYGILANHSPAVSAVADGELTYRTPNGETVIAAVSDGMVRIENNTVLVLVDTAELPDEIDENRARHAAEQAHEEMLQRKSIVSYRLAQTQMTRALSRIKVKNDSRK